MACDLEGGTEEGEQRKENERNKSKEYQHIHYWNPEEENQRNGIEKYLKV